MFLDILKNKDINKYLIFLFSTNFIYQIIRYTFDEYSYSHISLLAVQTITITIFLYFSDRNNRKSNKLKNILFIYLIYIVLSFLSRQYIGFDLSNSVLSLVTDITSFFILILYYYIIVETPIKKRDTEKLLMLYLYIALSFIAFAFIFQFNEIITAFTQSHAYASSFSSFFTNRNSFGFFLFLFYSVFLLQFKFYMFKIGKKYYYSIFTLILLATGFTLSRTSIIGIVLVTFMFVLLQLHDIFKRKKHKISKLIFFLIFVLILSILFLVIINNGNIINFVFNKVIRIEYKTTGRTDIWKVGIENLKSNWIFGMGSFEAIGTTAHLSFHNTTIDVLVRSGILGLGLKIYIFYAFLKYHFVNNLEDRNEKRYIIIYLLALLFVMQFESILLFKIGFRQILLLFIIFVFTSRILKNI